MDSSAFTLLTRTKIGFVLSGIPFYYIIFPAGIARLNYAEDERRGILKSMDRGKLKKVLVKDIMTKKAISVSPDTLVTDATKIITEHNFDGLPVIDQDNRLVGILTEYDLITKTSTVNVSLLQQILSDIYSQKKENAQQIGAGSISSLTVKDVMNKQPLALKENATFEEAIETFRAHHRVNPIPILDNNNKVVGVISRSDVLRPLNLLGYSIKK